MKIKREKNNKYMNVRDCFTTVIILFLLKFIHTYYLSFRSVDGEDQLEIPENAAPRIYKILFNKEVNK